MRGDKILVRKTKSYRFAMQKNADKKTDQYWMLCESKNNLHQIALQKNVPFSLVLI
jgi:hypothetical protein